ncbi:gliding motility-associated C-terminal domain-containing protein [Pedobacter agri]|uniref:T9SS type B sorting domain-containing protein n=1 Tax=Pedobacter agri TaxID=454586 RepID=UPI00292EBF57|nr:gliding motility-associated C-terminal domain-containing protein [Pedobacter agri]
MRYPKLFLILLFIFSNYKIFAQCSGALGDPIVNVDFGSGANTFGPPLTSGITNYNYIAGSPNDGAYTIAKTISGLNPGWIQNIVNHTPNDANGYMMVVNASNSPGIFYQSTVSGLCPGTTYEFAAWIINILRNTGIKPKVKFTIENNGSVIGSLVTPEIPEGSSTNWIRYSLTFTTPTNLGVITLKMTNENPGGTGNDLALDDITFRACGPVITQTVNNSENINANLCEGQSANYLFKATVSSDVYNNPKYQWQANTGNGWNDIIGQENKEYTASFVNAQAGVYQYRLITAEAENIGIATCRVATSPFSINVTAFPIANAENFGPVCIGQTIRLNASGGTSYSWTGPNFLSTEKSPTIINATKEMAGDYTVTVSINDCSTTATTTVSILDQPIVATNITEATICEGSSIALSASGGASYQWTPAAGLSDPNAPNTIASPTETTKYSVKVSNGACSETTQITINVNKKAIVEAGADQKIISGQAINFNGKITGNDFTYYWTPSDYLDDPLKLNPIAKPTEDITYTLHAISNLGCATITDDIFIKVYPQIVIPNTFSPNGDSVNDTWNIPTAVAFPNPIVKIVNRNGQLVYQSTGAYKPWDGKLNGKDLPPAVYYYTIYFNEDFETYSGWINLIR